MEKSRRKLRVCLFCVVLLAVVIGLVYYFATMGNAAGMDDGVLITGTGVRWEKLWQ